MNASSSASSRKRPVWLIPALIVGAIGLGLVFMPRSEPLPSINTTPVRLGTFTKTVTGTGSAKAASLQTLSFSPGVVGHVSQVLVKVGDSVERGQLLARVELSSTQRDLEAAQASLTAARADVTRASASEAESRRELERARQTAASQLASAQANYKQAQETLQQQRRLFDLGAISQQALHSAQDAAAEATRKLDAAQNELSYAQSRGLQGAAAATEQAKATLAAAEVRVKNLEKSLSDADLYSPISGVVSAVNLQVGSAPPQNALEITDPKQLYLEVPFDETRTTNLSEGQPAEVLFDALPQRTITGKISRIDPVARSSGQLASLNTRIMLFDVDDIRPGFTGTATVTTRRVFDALLVPLETLEDNQGQVNVWRASRDGDHWVVNPVPVKVLDRNTNLALVTGVKQGDEIVTPAPTSEQFKAGQAVDKKEHEAEKESAENLGKESHD